MANYATPLLNNSVCSEFEFNTHKYLFSTPDSEILCFRVPESFFHIALALPLWGIDCGSGTCRSGKRRHFVHFSGQFVR